MKELATDSNERMWGRGLHLLGMILTAAAVSAVAAMLYVPLTIRDTTLNERLTAAWQLLNDSEKITSDAEEARASLERANARIKTLREQIPETAQEAQFKAQLGRLAAEVEFEVIDYRPGAAEPHDFCEQIRVHVRGRGSYAAICRFLSGLDQLPRLCRTIAYSVDASRATDDEYDVDMTLMIFFGVRQDALDAAKEKSNG